MSNNNAISLRVLLGVFFVALFAMSSLALCSSGSPVSSTQANNTGVSPATSLSVATATRQLISSVQATWAATPYRTGTVHYYCDCGTVASDRCVAGNDSNSGLSTSLPKQTITSAISTLNSAPSGDTVALCQGGAFNIIASLHITASCKAGRTCKDLREYTPTTFTATAKPIINNLPGLAYLFTIQNGAGGVRILNLKLQGAAGTVGDGNQALFMYNGVHDMTIGNNDMDGFDLPIHDAPTATVANNNTTVTGNNITNTRSMAYLGGASNAAINYNYWDGNGSNDSRNHTIYFSGNPALTNVQLVGNYIHGQYGSSCLGAPVVAHGEITGFNISNNYIGIEASATTGGCWGIDLDNGGYTIANYFRSTNISGNTIVNGGNAPITVMSCPGCVIENNLIVNETAISDKGIYIPTYAARTSPPDDVNNNNTVRNNTIWYGTGSPTSGTGIVLQTEGTGHVVVNNTVYYSSTSNGNGGPFRCYSYPLSLTSYTFINNNNCYSASTYFWEAARGSLSAWQTYATTPGFDTVSFTGDPMFTAAGTDFTPAVGSPLIGAGNAQYESLTDITGKARPNAPAIGAFGP